MSDWMGRLPCFVKEKALCMLVIPGSHDSGAFWLNVDMDYPHDQSFIDYIRKLRCRLVKNIVKRWGLTQTYSIQDQLEFGIRFFDLRIELALDQRNMSHPEVEEDPDDPISKSCFIVHGLYGSDWLKLAYQFVDFLKVHKEEVVIINVSHMFRMTDFNFRRFFLHPLANIAGRAGIRLCSTKVDMRTITLEQLLASNFRIIVVGPSDRDWDDICFRSCTIQNKWPNKNSASEIISFIQAEVHAPVTPGLRVMQGVITPTLKDIIRNFRQTLRIVFSLPMRGLLKEWIKGLDEEEAGNLNILISDQIDVEYCRLAYYSNVKECPEWSLDGGKNPLLENKPAEPEAPADPSPLATPPAAVQTEAPSATDLLPTPPPSLTTDHQPRIIELVAQDAERRSSEPEFIIEEIFDDFALKNRASVMIQQVEMVLDDHLEGTSTRPISPIPPPKPRRHTQRIPIVMEVEPIPDDAVPTFYSNRTSVSSYRGRGTPVRIALPVTEEELRLAALGEYPTYGSELFHAREETQPSMEPAVEQSVEQIVERPAEQPEVQAVEEEEASDESSPLLSNDIENMVENLVISSTIDAMDNLAGRFQTRLD